jgi:hypothetical protein
MTMECANPKCNEEFPEQGNKRYCSRNCGYNTRRDRRRGTVADGRTFEQAMAAAYAQARSRATQICFHHDGSLMRGKHGEITTDVIDHDAVCAYTGLSLRVVYDQDRTLTYPSLDRIDNDSGYDAANVVWTFRGLNYMRNRVAMDEVFEFLQQIKDGL